MFKKIIYILIINALFSSIVFAEQIKKVEISGNKRIPEQTILVLGKISLDDDFNDQKINDSFKSLYDSNFFKDIKISLSNGLLKIIVIENPIIEDIEIVGLKNKGFIDKIYEVMSLKNRMSFTEIQLKRDILIIENALKTSGYYFGSVKSSKIVNEKLNSVRLKIYVEQGKKAKIKEIIFIGDKKIKGKKLLEIIASEEHKFWKFISNKVYLNQSTIDLDKRLLQNYYQNLGFKTVKVQDSYAELNNQGNFKLTFNIDAGKKYYFNDLKLDLPDDYNLSDFKDVEKIFKNLKGNKYSIDDFNKILKEIDKIASARLYDFIDAKVDEKVLSQNKIDFIFRIVDSEKVYVERINVLGNFNTIEEVIRNKLIVDEGDPLNTLLYNKSLDNVRSLNIFKSVKGEIRDGTSQNMKIVDLLVEEKPTGEISLAAGVGTAGSTIGGGIKENNFLGKGVGLTANLELSEEGAKGQFTYSKPNFAYTDNTLFTSVKSTTSDNLSDFGYKTEDIGFSIGTEFEQYENLFFSPELDFTVEDLTTNSKASSSLKKQQGTYEDIYFNYGLSYDLRNSRYKPSSGSKTSFRQEVPVVSGNNELGNSFIYTKYKSLNDVSGMVGKASFYLKTINTLDNSDVRISKRAQIPYHRLRGFEKGKVGPIDSNADYIGGNYVSSINFSTNLPAIFSSVENIDFTYFVDLGSVWGVDYDSSIDDSSSIRSSTGLGMDVLTPIGPLSFSLSQPITKKSSDKTETFRFSLGTTF